MPATEFLRRFLLHVLPKGFVRIRHYGFLANRHRSETLELCGKLLRSDEAVSESAGDQGEADVLVEAFPCPVCNDGLMCRVYRFEAGEAPAAFRSLTPAKPP